jgi:hypothetical protein
MDNQQRAFSKGLVEFVELPGMLSPQINRLLTSTTNACDEDREQALTALLQAYGRPCFQKSNLIFNYPREQYARLDRGETPLAINASWFTLANETYSNPAVETVGGETLRVAASTKATDPVNPKNSIVRFVLDVGQFVGSWTTAILIGGADADNTPGSGKIIAAVNDIRDDSNLPLNRDGTTIHLVSWKLKHLDSSEV